MTRNARGWLGTAAGAAAAGVWSVHDAVAEPWRTVLAAIAGLLIGIFFVQLQRLGPPDQ